MEEHSATWQLNAAQLGLTTAQITALTGAVASAQEDYAAAIKARSESKAASLTAQNSLEAALRLTANAIRDIDATAQNNANPDSVYVIAQIPPPAPPSPAVPPGTPEAFKVELKQNGGITLTWKCKNESPTGVFYTVRRAPRGSTDGPWVQLGVATKRVFTDDTLPAGDGVIYEVRAQRGELLGNAVQVVVYFGNAGGGGRSASVVSETTTTTSNKNVEGKAA